MQELVMPKFNWSGALRGAAAAGMLMSCLGGGLSAFAQGGRTLHPPDRVALKADVPPAPAGDTADSLENGEKKEIPSKDEGKVVPAVEEEKQVEVPTCDFLQRLFDDSNGHNYLDDYGLKLHGWVGQSFTFNPDRPDTRTNGPVSFTDRANEYQLNQVYLIFERVLDQTKEDIQFGGRVDALFGSDYFFTTSRGLELEQDGTQRWNSQDGPNRTVFGPDNGRLHGFALPQGYAEIAGYNSSVKIGHFYTILGFDVVADPQNFFATHSYAFQYGEPFTHTGILWNYKLNDNWSLNNGIVQGWDNTDDTNDTKSYIGGVNYDNKETGTSIAVEVIHGEERLVFDGTSDRRGDRTLYTVMLKQNLTDKWTWIIQHDRGSQQAAVARPDGTFQKAEWYGVNNNLHYQINDKWKVGGRYEWFRDDDGFRVLRDGEGADYHAVSLGLNWKMMDCVMLRPECRYDWASKSGNRPFDLADNPAGGTPIGTKGHQFLFTTDLVITY
jgi:hypothetical protein